MTESLVTAAAETTAGLDPVTASRRVLEQSVQSAVIATSEELDRVSHDPGVNATSLAYARLNNLWPQQRRLRASQAHLPVGQIVRQRSTLLVPRTGLRRWPCWRSPAPSS